MSRKGFQPGHTGRPRGTRNKLAGRVFEDIFAHWCEPVAPGSNVCRGQEALQHTRHDEMATPSKPAQKTARAVEGPRAGAAGNPARVHGERRRGAELDRDL